MITLSSFINNQSSIILLQVQYGGYISIAKLLLFLASFFLWLWLVGWVYRDAQAVETNEDFWTGLVLGTGAAGAVICLLVPLFVIGILLYLAAVAAPALAYVRHRNTRVLDFDRVLTADHIKGLFVSKQKKLDALKGFVFVTANNNEVPIPQAKTPDFFGYKAAHETLNDAMWRRASTVLFAPNPQHYDATYYVDGAALKQPTIPRDHMEYLIRFLKQLADLDTKEKRKPQKGMFKIRQNKDDTEWELVTAGSTAGEQLRLKQILKQDITRLRDIGLMPEQFETLSKLRERKQGLFLVTGPAKSGVTTTLYALLRNHDAFLNSINTLETVPSAELPNITQNVFSLSDTGTTTYAQKLQTVVRMGPDIVGVSECTDEETAKVACKAATDAKVVYVVLKADSVVKALGRWMRLVGDRKLVARTLLGISNQRLVRKLCNECKQAYAPNKDLFRKFNLSAEKTKVLYRAGKVIYDKRGKPSPCQNCQETGFFGRTAVFEMITLDDELRKAIMQSKSLSEIAQRFRGARMLYLQEQALRKVIAGATSINEMVRVLSVAKKPDLKRPQPKEPSPDSA
jgi:type II secretory ATPase GspE/PulE/Tfp pilus assembly ATPase PilB-like protein